MFGIFFLTKLLLKGIFCTQMAEFPWDIWWFTTFSYGSLSSGAFIPLGRLCVLSSQQPLKNSLSISRVSCVSQEEKISTRNQGFNGDTQVPKEHRSSAQEGTLLSPGE